VPNAGRLFADLNPHEFFGIARDGSGAAEGVAYTIQASENFTPVNWTLTVTEVVGADAANIQAGFIPPLPALHAGWIYRTFRSAGPVAGDPEEFMRIKISE